MTIDRVAPDFFTGVEVENSPAKGMRTLFVVGLQSIDNIVYIVNESNALLDTSKHINHIYLGANMSLHGVANNDYYTWRQWDSMVAGLLEIFDSNGIKYITVDFTLAQVEGFLDSSMSDDSRIIPMISATLPYTKLLNYNTTIKIDDKDFNATNPGVWCHSLHKLMDRETFTPWHAYVGDNPVTKETK
jgi:hypothetical protein